MFAEMDLRALKPYRVLIKEVGLRHCVDPALIAAIISRESHGGVVLKDGWDHKGLKFGLMQVLRQKPRISPTSSFLTDPNWKSICSTSRFQNTLLLQRNLSWDFSITSLAFHSRFISYWISSEKTFYEFHKYNLQLIICNVVKLRKSYKGHYYRCLLWVYEVENFIHVDQTTIIKPYWNELNL